LAARGLPMTQRLIRYRIRVAVVLALLGPIVIGAVLVPIRTSFASTAAALVMVTLIVFVAVMGNRVTGVLASILGALWFDFFLTKPYEQFSIDHQRDLETTIAIFVVGVILTELAGRSRHHWRASNDSTSYLSMLHAVTVLAADSVPVAVIVEQACASLVNLLSLRSCRFDGSLSDPPLARIEANGEIVHVGMRWPVGEIGIPGPESEILDQWRGRVLGRFVMTPTPGVPVTLEQRMVAVALVDVVAAYVRDEHRAL
jgi:hypothetical protein